MSGFLKHVFQFTLLFLFYILILLYYPQIAAAEPLFILKSEYIKKPIDDSTDKTTTLGFDDKGNLTIRKGNLTVVLIVNPPGSENAALSNKAPVRMAMNHENPEIQGVGVRVGYAF